MAKPANYLHCAALKAIFLAHFVIAGEPRPPIITEHPTSSIVPKNEPITINCKADGEPVPVIKWFKDGHEVQTAPALPHSHRVVLPTGSLFFLRVMQTRRDQDGGVYWCEAENEYGIARSRNATIEVSVLNDYFRMMPMSSKVGQGDTAVLKCLAPKGNPRPTTAWFKNDQLVNPRDSKRIHITDTGNLVLKDVEKTDAGDYYCQAENIAGVRRSDAATLSVHVKPYLLSEPDDLNVKEGEDATLRCQVGGDPLPEISWGREDGAPLDSRAVTDRDNSLHIYSVLSSDEGVYYCTAENAVGSVTESVSLTVHAEPLFLVRPAPQVVGLNGVAEMTCSAAGSPAPTIFWTKEGDQNLMFPGTSHGIFHVSEDGLLTINGVREEDTGYYVCSALSAAGSVSAKAYLEVVSIKNSPPPIIGFGPTNQTLPLNTSATLPCKASGPPEPEVGWFKNSTPLLPSPNHVVDAHGTLVITDLLESDTGLYTCVASSASGQTSWSAYISVQDPKNPNIIFHRSPDPLTFPSAPLGLRVGARTPTSVNLSWRENPATGASQTIGYTVEYYSSDLQTGWVVASYRIPETSYTVENLRPETDYVFIVRAENSHGSSQPSPISRHVRTLKLGGNNREENVELARDVLLTKLVEIVDLEAISSTSVRLTWNLMSRTPYIQGFYIRFCDMSGGSRKFNIITILKDAVTNNYVVTNLRKYTKYQFFLTPFYKAVEGQPSNSRTIQTLEDIPSAAPTDLKASAFNGTSAVISWAPPPPQHRNGMLEFYGLKLESNTSLVSTFKVNVSTTSLLLPNLTADTVYLVRITAFTNMGSGPYSAPVLFTLDPDSQASVVGYGPQVDDLGAQTWFIALISGILFVLVVLFIVLIVYRQIKSQAIKRIDHQCIKDFDISSAKGYRADNLWITHSEHSTNEKQTFIRSVDVSNEAGSSIYAEVGEGLGGDPRFLTSFATNFDKHQYQDPEPYATTTLALQNRFGQERYLTSEFADNSQFKSYRSSSSSAGSSSKSTSGSGMYIPNWSEMFPPPPPFPPSDGPASDAEGASLRGLKPQWNKNLSISSHPRNDSQLSHPLATLPGNQPIIPVNQSPILGQAVNQSSFIGQAGNQSPLIGPTGSQSNLIGPTGSQPTLIGQAGTQSTLIGQAGTQSGLIGGNQSSGCWGPVNLLSNPLQPYNQPFQEAYDSSLYTASDIYENPSEHYASIHQGVMRSPLPSHRKAGAGAPLNPLNSFNPRKYSSQNDADSED